MEISSFLLRGRWLGDGDALPAGSVITHYDTFILKGCKVPWALRGGIAVITMTAAELPGNRLHRFLLFSPDSRCFAKHRPSGGSEKSNVFAACP